VLTLANRPIDSLAPGALGPCGCLGGCVSVGRSRSRPECERAVGATAAAITAAAVTATTTTVGESGAFLHTSQDLTVTTAYECTTYLCAAMDSELTIVTCRPKVAPHLWCRSDQPSGQPGDRQKSVWLGTRCSSMYEGTGFP
jgi:hypothetical protein